jgi:hypothetical protein
MWSDWWGCMRRMSIFCICGWLGLGGRKNYKRKMRLKTKNVSFGSRKRHIHTYVHKQIKAKHFFFLCRRVVPLPPLFCRWVRDSAKISHSTSVTSPTQHNTTHHSTYVCTYAIVWSLRLRHASNPIHPTHSLTSAINSTIQKFKKSKDSTGRRNLQWRSIGMQKKLLVTMVNFKKIKNYNHKRVDH